MLRLMNPCDCFTEVERLHRFFADWFVGRIGFDALAECESALAPGFTMVTPDGRTVDREPLLGAIRDQHDSRDSTFSIDVVLSGCIRFDDVHVTRYEEHHRGPDPSHRLSTAVITNSASGFQWQTVHETWSESSPIVQR